MSLPQSISPDNLLSGSRKAGQEAARKFRSMTSPQRFHVPGLRHFVTFNTYKRRRYLMPERTRDIIVEVLQKILVTHRAACAGFVIMPDHVHAILLGPGDGEFDVSSIAQVWKKT